MKIELLENIDPETWDKLISEFDSKYVCHQSSWLNFIKETQGGEIYRFRIFSDSKIVGYFVGIIINKGPIKIFGSPLAGWTTHYLGPIVNTDFDFENFLFALDKLCHKMKIHHIEIANPMLNPELMRNMKYNISVSDNYLVSLSDDENEMWSKISPKARNKIRQAIRNGLTVENTDDPNFVNLYYKQLIEVFAKQKLFPTFSIDRVKSLFNNLKPDSLISLQVKLGDKIIATGLFPHDSKCMIFWGGATSIKYQNLRPNDLLHWESIKLASKLGIKKYDYGGAGSFKKKFGGQKITEYWYYKSSSNLVKFGRETYKYFFSLKQKIKGVSLFKNT